MVPVGGEDTAGGDPIPAAAVGDPILAAAVGDPIPAAAVGDPLHPVPRSARTVACLRSRALLEGRTDLPYSDGVDPPHSGTAPVARFDNGQAAPNAAVLRNPTSAMLLEDCFFGIAALLCYSSNKDSFRRLLYGIIKASWAFQLRARTGEFIFASVQLWTFAFQP